MSADTIVALIKYSQILKPDVTNLFFAAEVIRHTSHQKEFYMDNTNVSLVEMHREDILHLFHSMQNRKNTKNYITSSERMEIAQPLGLSIAEVDGVLSFYHLFSTSPRGRYVLRICDSLSCRIGNSLEVYGFISKKLGIKRGETTKDGLFTLEIVNCLGSCDTAPNMMINDKIYTKLTLEEIDALIINCRKEVTV